MSIIGERFGRLVVLARSPSREKNSYWSCRCDCGAEVIAMGGNLRRGRTTSCGCFANALLSARSTTHGHCKPKGWTTEYRIWSAMKRRCFNPKCPEYKDYGGRGITVCAAWRDSFEQFYRDMGPRPSGLTLDRRDNDGHYEPGNCLWATWLEQQAPGRRRRSSHRRASA